MGKIIFGKILIFMFFLCLCQDAVVFAKTNVPKCLQEIVDELKDSDPEMCINNPGNVAPTAHICYVCRWCFEEWGESMLWRKQLKRCLEKNIVNPKMVENWLNQNKQFLQDKNIEDVIYKKLGEYKQFHPIVSMWEIDKELKQMIKMRLEEDEHYNKARNHLKKGWVENMARATLVFFETISNKFSTKNLKKMLETWGESVEKAQKEVVGEDDMWKDAPTGYPD